MRKFLQVIALSIIVSSCQKLDSFMFANIELTEYKLDDFTDEVDFILNSTYDIEEDKITQLEFYSGAGESEALIYGYYLGEIDCIATDTVIMYCHGNYGHIDYYWQRAKALANIGQKNRFGVLIVDYKGFGMSKGTPTEEGLIEDTNEGLKWLKEKGLTNDRLIIYGFSLGSYPSTYLASKKEGALFPSKLILEAPFASTKVMVNDASKLSMSNKFFVSTDFENADLIKDVNQPFLWLHGVQDDFLAMETHGEVVFKNYSGEYGEAHRIEGAGHSTVPQLVYDSNYKSNSDGTPQVIDVENYNKILLDFIVR